MRRRRSGWIFGGAIRISCAPGAHPGGSAGRLLADERSRSLLSLPAQEDEPVAIISVAQSIAGYL